MDYHWYPGHMTKAIRMMRENISLVDLVLEIVYARIPESGRNPDIDSLAEGKIRLLVMNKADLADEAVTAAWRKKLEEQGIHTVSLDARSGKGMAAVKKQIEVLAAEKREKDAKRGIIGRPLRMMICGIPNVGKSTLINSLAGRVSAKTGNKPGVTKGKQWITIGTTMQLMDTPGILWPRFEDVRTGQHLAMVGSMNDDNLDPAEMSLLLLEILLRYYQKPLLDRYGITEEEAVEAYENLGLPKLETGYLHVIALKRGCLIRGGEPDYTRAGNLILDDFRSGRIARISLERPVTE